MEGAGSGLPFSGSGQFQIKWPVGRSHLNAMLRTILELIWGASWCGVGRVEWAGSLSAPMGPEQQGRVVV